MISCRQRPQRNMPIVIARMASIWTWSVVM
jgi:hypothetical protein